MKRQRRAVQKFGSRRDAGFFWIITAPWASGSTVKAWALSLFDRYLVEQKVEVLTAITPLMVENFLSSRPRKVAKSYNQLLGVLQRWFNWLVVQGATSTIRQCILNLGESREGGNRSYLSRTKFRRLLAVTAQLPGQPTCSPAWLGLLDDVRTVLWTGPASGRSRQTPPP